MKKGFTLIELLIVVAIIGILAGVGIPMYNGYMADAKIATTEANHKTIFQYMLNEATKCEINSSGGLLPHDGANLLKCSDLFGSNVNTGKVNMAMYTYFNANFTNFGITKSSDWLKIDQYLLLYIKQQVTIGIFSRATSAAPNFAVIRQRAAGVHKAFLTSTQKVKIRIVFFLYLF